MTTQSVLLWECTAEEVGYLPAGFPVIEYDSLYSSIRLIHAQADRVRHDKRFVYLLHKEPPVSFVGVKGTRHGKIQTASQKTEDFVPGSSTVKSSVKSTSGTCTAPIGACSANQVPERKETVL